MTVSESAFAQAWLLLKSQEDGVNFTQKEHQFITGTILKMMNSDDLRLQEEAGMLYAKYRQLS
tara:strand:- start:34335 stop:34523 length:189 start_codon:yes stop_codon:yes gene_type:complete